MGLFITEGGVAGHMNHLYDNPNLTFKEMKKIFQAASQANWKVLKRPMVKIFNCLMILTRTLHALLAIKEISKMVVWMLLGLLKSLVEEVH